MIVQEGAKYAEGASGIGCRVSEEVGWLDFEKDVRADGGRGYWRVVGDRCLISLDERRKPFDPQLG
jgi:hypothetical protein